MKKQTFALIAGAHAPSSARYYLGEQCTRFTAKVGIDDEQPTRGSVTFSIKGDDKVLTETDVLKRDSPTKSLDVDVTGVKYLDLVVGNGGDGNGNDHADWADAAFSCSP